MRKLKDILWLWKFSPSGAREIVESRIKQEKFKQKIATYPLPCVKNGLADDE